MYGDDMYSVHAFRGMMSFPEYRKLIEFIADNYDDPDRAIEEAYMIFDKVEAALFGPYYRLMQDHKWQEVHRIMAENLTRDKEHAIEIEIPIVPVTSEAYVYLTDLEDIIDEYKRNGQLPADWEDRCEPIIYKMKAELLTGA